MLLIAKGGCTSLSEIRIAGFVAVICRNLPTAQIYHRARVSISRSSDSSTLLLTSFKEN